jgi:L-ascorbate metabolism protein UlaG (beta-lactamase superfamily)
MIITFYGEGCFKVQSGEMVVLTDPPAKESGLEAPRFKFDIMLRTLSAFPPEAKNFYELVGPGEYNFKIADKEIDILGIFLAKESTDKFIKTIYLVNLEDIKLCFLGHLSNDLSPEIIEKLEEIDILFIPAGGKPFIDQKRAASLIKQLEPKVVVPSFYKISNLKRPADDLKKFLKECDYEASQEEKLVIKKKDLQTIKGTKIISLKV